MVGSFFFIKHNVFSLKKKEHNNFIFVRENGGTVGVSVVCVVANVFSNNYEELFEQKYFIPSYNFKCFFNQMFKK